MQPKSLKFQVSSFKFKIFGLLLLFYFQHAWSQDSLNSDIHNRTYYAAYLQANTLYSKGDFVKAAEAYEEVISAGYESPELYYNLGNAYFKLNNIGKTILNYERAKKLAPQDEDIAFNLKLAGQRTIDKIEALPVLFLNEWWDNLKSAHSEKTWSMRSIGCFVIFLFFLGIFMTSKRSINKQFGFWLGIVFFIFSGISFSVAKSRYHDIIIHNDGVILSSSVEVKNAPADNGKKLFILHEGAKITAPETKGDWVRIELSKEKVGWVKRSQIEFI